MHNIMDGLFNGMAGSEFYRAQVFPELFPHEKPMLTHNWPEDDQEMFCGMVCHPPTLRYTSSEAGKDG